MYVNFLFIGGPEIFIIVLIVVMVFGADKIPEIARGLGKGIRQVKEATNDIKKEINDSAKDQGSCNHSRPKRECRVICPAARRSF